MLLPELLQMLFSETKSQRKNISLCLTWLYERPENEPAGKCASATRAVSRSGLQQQPAALPHFKLQRRVITRLIEAIINRLIYLRIVLI